MSGGERLSSDELATIAFALGLYSATVASTADTRQVLIARAVRMNELVNKLERLTE